MAKLAPIDAYPCLDYQFWGDNPPKGGAKTGIKELAQKDFTSILSEHFNLSVAPWIKRKCTLNTSPVFWGGDAGISYKICLNAPTNENKDLMVGDNLIFNNTTYTIVRLEIGAVITKLYLQDA